MIVRVDDWGSGMTREIIESGLTRLFSSSKDGDRTKIGKFGIGFVSVFAIEPEAISIDTSREGEHWRVLFDEHRRFSLIRREEPVEGTKIAIYKRASKAEFEQFRARALEVLRYWCKHVAVDIRVDGERINEPFELGTSIEVRREHEDELLVVGHPHDGVAFAGFYKRGLTLIEEPLLPGIAFKASSPNLEHTLTRDDVIKDGHFGKVVSRLQELARGPLRERVFAQLDALVRAEPWPSVPGPAAEQLQILYAAALWHLCANKGLPRALAKFACARAPSGSIWTWAALRDAAKGEQELLLASARTPLSDAAEQLGRAVVLSFAGVDEHARNLEPTAMSSLMRAMAWVQPDTQANWLGRAYFMPLMPEPAEVRQWASLATATARLLDDSDHRIAKVEFGRFGESGSLLEGRAAISQRELGELTPASEAGSVGKGLFSRRRNLVVDADHPTVRTLLGLALREPELAAYQLVKLFLLGSASIPTQVDAKLADLAMSYREARCPRPMS
jgi:hypothetical protein